MTTKTLDPITSDETLVAVSRCLPSPFNKPRPLDEEFVASIKAEGIVQPILLRPHPSGEDYEIVCGHRRVAACAEIGLPEIPALVRVMDDDQVRRAILIENKQRAPLTPWQEAELVSEYLADGLDVRAMAAALGWSESQVRRRAKLLDLSETWRSVIGSATFKNWTTAMLETIAGFDARTQDAFHSEIETWDVDDWTMDDLSNFITKHTQLLKAAPFDLEDVMLVAEAGACTGCPKRSDAQEDLFGEVEGMIKRGACCLDGGCFAAKKSAHLARRKEELEEKNPGLQVVSKEYTSDKSALQPNQWEPAKAKDKGAVPAMNAATGEKLWVKPTGAKQPDGPGRKKKDDEARLADHEKRRVALTLKKLEDWIEADDLVDSGKDARDVLIQYILVFGFRGIGAGTLAENAKRVRDFARRPVTTKEIWEQLQFELAAARHNERKAAAGVEPDLDNPIIQLIAWMVDADLKAMKKEADEELPLPVSLGGPGKKRAAEDLAAGMSSDEIGSDGDDGVDL